MFDKYINDNRNISISGYDSKFPKKKFNTEAGSLVLIFRHHLMRNFISLDKDIHIIVNQKEERLVENLDNLFITRNIDLNEYWSKEEEERRLIVLDIIYTCLLDVCKLLQWEERIIKNIRKDILKRKFRESIVYKEQILENDQKLFFTIEVCFGLCTGCLRMGNEFEHKIEIIPLMMNEHFWAVFSKDFVFDKPSRSYVNLCKLNKSIIFKISVNHKFFDLFLYINSPISKGKQIWSLLSFVPEIDQKEKAKIIQNKFTDLEYKILLKNHLSKNLRNIVFLSSN